MKAQLRGEREYVDEIKGTTILIATSQQSLRSGLSVYLSSESNMCVVAEAHDSHELFKKIESTCPEIILLDWELLDRATPILINSISAIENNPSIIILSTEDNNKQAALDAGSDGYVNISHPPRLLADEINKVVQENILNR